MSFTSRTGTNLFCFGFKCKARPNGDEMHTSRSWESGACVSCFMNCSIKSPLPAPPRSNPLKKEKTLLSKIISPCDGWLDAAHVRTHNRARTQHICKSSHTFISSASEFYNCIAVIDLCVISVLKVSLTIKRFASLSLTPFKQIGRCVCRCCECVCVCVFCSSRSGTEPVPRRCLYIV